MEYPEVHHGEVNEVIEELEVPLPRSHGNLIPTHESIKEVHPTHVEVILDDYVGASNLDLAFCLAIISLHFSLGLRSHERRKERDTLVVFPDYHGHINSINADNILHCCPPVISFQFFFSRELAVWDAVTLYGAQKKGYPVLQGRP